MRVFFDMGKIHDAVMKLLHEEKESFLFGSDSSLNTSIVFFFI